AIFRRAAGRSDTVGTELQTGHRQRDDCAARISAGRDLLQHASFLRRTRPRGARAVARLHRPRDSDRPAQNGRQAGARTDHVHRARAEVVDRRMMSAEQVSAVLANLAQLRAAGLYKDALAYHDVGGIQVAAAWAWMPDASTEAVATLDPNGSAAPFPDAKKLL